VVCLLTIVVQALLISLIFGAMPGLSGVPAPGAIPAP
jgi:hypothetical protein